MGQMSGMMGQTGANSNSAGYFWALFAVLAALTIISVVGFSLLLSVSSNQSWHD
jgi:hypothetical protein